jgi:hypothetical protein
MNAPSLGSTNGSKGYIVVLFYFVFHIYIYTSKNTRALQRVMDKYIITISFKLQGPTI